jgi:hypothetical protein
MIQLTRDHISNWDASSRKTQEGALTLIEAEVLESVGLTGTESRRQVAVRGVRLNDLVGSAFGSVTSSA